MRPMTVFALAALGLAAAGLHAEPRPIGAASVQVFDAKLKDLKARRCTVLYQAEPEALVVQMDGVSPGQPLHARLQADSLPHYDTWMAQRQAEGGLAWKVLSGLLQDVQGRPAVFLSLLPVPVQGSLELRIGLLNGSHFELFAVVQGQVSSSKRGLSFKVTDFRPEKASAKAAWAVLAPLARSQAARMAGQR